MCVRVRACGVRVCACVCVCWVECIANDIVFVSRHIMYMEVGCRERACACVLLVCMNHYSYLIRYYEHLWCVCACVCVCACACACACVCVRMCGAIINAFSLQCKSCSAHSKGFLMVKWRAPTTRLTEETLV